MNNDSSTGFDGRSGDSGRARAASNEQAGKGTKEGGKKQKSASQKKPPQSLGQRDSGRQSLDSGSATIKRGTKRTKQEPAQPRKRRRKPQEIKEDEEARKKEEARKLEEEEEARKEEQARKLEEVRKDYQDRLNAEDHALDKKAELIAKQREENKAERKRALEEADDRVLFNKDKDGKMSTYRFGFGFKPTDSERLRFRGRPGTLTHAKLRAFTQTIEAEEMKANKQDFDEAEYLEYLEPEQWHLKNHGGTVEIWPTITLRAKELLNNPNVKEVVNTPKTVLERAAIIDDGKPKLNYVFSSDLRQDADNYVQDWMALKREVQKPGPFKGNVYSCVQGQYNYTDPPSKWVPYAADDFFADLQETSGRRRDADGKLLPRVEGPPPFPENPPTKALPQTELLEQIHRYVSGWAHKNCPLLMEQLDESVLLGMGVAVEEKMKELLGKNGEMFYAVKEGAGTKRKEK